MADVCEICRFTSAGEEQTRTLGARLAELCRMGDCIALVGDLGAGKTAFARGFIAALGAEGEVTSPTFTLVQTYPAAPCTVWHFDLYRLESAQEVYETGLEEALQSGIAMIEWPQVAQALLPASHLQVRIDFSAAADLRTIRFAANDKEWSERLSLLQGQAA